MNSVIEYKDFLGKPALELTSVLNKAGRKYTIEKPGVPAPTDIVHNRVRIKVDNKLKITSLLTG